VEHSEKRREGYIAHGALTRLSESACSDAPDAYKGSPQSPACIRAELEIAVEGKFDSIGD
jgi:hypothetical protein